MNDIKKEDIKQEVFDLYDDYAHSRINRRDFMQKLSLYAVGGITVSALMSFLMPDYKNTLKVQADDPRITSEYIYYDSPKGGGKIKAPLLLQYARLDTRVNEGAAAYEAELKANGKEYTVYVYPNVNHGFHNDTTPRYDKAAAELAWQRTIDFFKEKLQ